MINYKQLSGKVEDCLKKDEASRNSDIRLYNFLLLNYPKYKDLLLISSKGQYSIPLMARYDLPKEEDVCRIRRKLNSKGLYLPTDQNVIKQRRLAESEWHDEMQQSNPSLF